MNVLDAGNPVKDRFVFKNAQACDGSSAAQRIPRKRVSMEESAGVLQEARQVVMKTLDSSTAEERGDWGVMQEKIRADLKRYIGKQTSRRPLIMPVILEV